MKLFAFSILIGLLIFSVFFIHTPKKPLSPRVLVTLGPQCDFHAKDLCNHVDALIFRGSEEELFNLIQTTENNLVVICENPIEDPLSFSIKTFYDSIHLDGPFGESLQVLLLKLQSTPKNDRDLPKISPEKRGQFYKLMVEVDQILNQHNIRYWGISGTLLGAIRHGGMIPWDDDLDIVIQYADKSRFEELHGFFHERGLELANYEDLMYKIFPIHGESLRDYRGEEIPWKFPAMDIFLVHQHTGRFRIVLITDPKIDIYATTQKRPGWSLLFNELDGPIHRVPFGPMQLPIPHNATEILTREYGPDWQNTAYLHYSHEKEQPLKSVKVPIFDFSPPEYVWPKN